MCLILADFLHDSQVVYERKEVAPREISNGFRRKGVDGISKLVDFRPRRSLAFTAGISVFLLLYLWFWWGASAFDWWRRGLIFALFYYVLIILIQLLGRLFFKS